MSEGEARRPALDYEVELGRLRVRVADAELRAEGAKHGMHDPDALRMLDEKDRLRAMEKGGTEKALAKLRKEKLWLLATSVNAAAPAASVDAMTMSHEQWRGAKAALLRKQRASR